VRRSKAQEQLILGQEIMKELVKKESTISIIISNHYYQENQANMKSFMKKLGILKILKLENAVIEEKLIINKMYLKLMFHQDLI
jgi:hypothetical protein